MYRFVDCSGSERVLLCNFELDPEYYLKQIDKLASKLNENDERTYTVVVTSETAKTHFELIEAIRKEYDVQVVEHMPKAVVLGDVFQLPPVDFVDVIANRNNHFLHGRGSKGDRIRRRQQFNNQCGYKGRRK